MSGKPPAKETSVLKKLEERLAALDQASNAEDDACNLALELGADTEAQSHYDNCIRLSRERSAVHAEIGAFYDEKAKRLETLRSRKGGRKTRRRKQKGKGITLSKTASDVCEGVGCPTRERQKQREAERVAKEALQKARSECWIQTGMWPPDNWNVGDPCPRPPPSPQQLAELEQQRQRAAESEARLLQYRVAQVPARHTRQLPNRPVDSTGKRLPTGRRIGGKTRRRGKSKK